MMKKLLCLVLAVLTVLSAAGCGNTEETVEGLLLYTLTGAEMRPGGDIITASVVPWDELPDERSEQAKAVMELLMQSEDSPLPMGTLLRSVEIAGSTAYVDLGGAYTTLSGMDLTIADYCITLSLTQLTGVYAVRIMAEGRESHRRAKQVLLAGDALLSSMDDVVRTLTAKLYFPNENGVLTAEERLLTQYEGDSAAKVVLEALSNSPEDEALLPLLPEGFIGMTARMEAGVCHLNIPADSMALLGEKEEQTVQAIARSLLSVEGIREVQLYIDGQPQGNID